MADMLDGVCCHCRRRSPDWLVTLSLPHDRVSLPGALYLFKYTSQYPRNAVRRVNTAVLDGITVNRFAHAGSGENSVSGNWWRTATVHWIEEATK